MQKQLRSVDEVKSALKKERVVVPTRRDQSAYSRGVQDALAWVLGERDRIYISPQKSPWRITP
jgi:hypothetical protein